MTNRAKAILGLSGVFILGLVCGALALGLFVRDLVQERHRLKNPEGFHEYFADELNLTGAQRDSLELELERAYEEMADIRQQVELEYRQVFDTLARRMAPVLTQSQRRILAEHKERLLPQREAGEKQADSPASIDEIDRRVATAPKAAIDDAGTDRTGELKRADGAERNGADASPAEQSGPDSIEDPVDALAGDSLLTAATREENLPRIVAHLKNKLDLTDDQAAKVTELFRKTVRRNAWIRENFRDEPLVRTRRLRQSFRMLDRQVAGLLTEEQRTKYKGMRKRKKK